MRDGEKAGSLRHLHRQMLEYDYEKGAPGSFAGTA